MYTLANVDFSNRLGTVVSELPPDKFGDQETLEGAGLNDLAAASSGKEEAALSMAVFGAA